jgi:hypothetical protein
MTYIELIYTRCQNGIDILRKGQPITSQGLKVYATNLKVFNDGMVDLPLLGSVIQICHPFEEPDFMEEAYLYYVPDKENSFLLNFYPVPFDPGAVGDFPKRPGNFLNQVLVGDFTEFYAFETFRDVKIWDAKTRGEGFYYANDTAELLDRDISDPIGRYLSDDIQQFIADGRSECLKSAIAFLISQFTLEPHKRKYLVINDESAQNIELWIAGILSAFSPRVAAHIAFATRMSKFKFENEYFVNISNDFQKQKNLSDPNLKLRYHHMIVGVDTHDQTNMSDIRVEPNSPFVVLDGVKKQFSISVDTSDKYYQTVCCFGSEQERFCREFLQMFDLKTPSVDVLDIFDIFISMESLKTIAPTDLVRLLARLQKYEIFDTNKFRKQIYSPVEKDLVRYFETDTLTTLEIINFLQIFGKKINDETIRNRIVETINHKFVDLLFRRNDVSVTQTFWSRLSKSDFALDIAKKITDLSTLAEFSNFIQSSSAEEFRTFYAVYIDCYIFLTTGDNKAKTESILSQSLERVTKYSCDFSVKNDDFDTLSANYKLLNSVIKNSTDFIWDIAMNGDDRYQRFIIDFLVSSDDNIIQNEKNTTDFCQKILNIGNEKSAIKVLCRRLNHIADSTDYPAFYETVKSLQINAYSEIIGFALWQCSLEKNHTKATNIIVSLNKSQQIHSQQFLLIIATTRDTSFAYFVVTLLIDLDDTITQSQKSIRDFYDLLKTFKIEQTISIALAYKLKTIKQCEELKQFVSFLVEFQSIEKSVLITIYETIDAKLDILNFAGRYLATDIQKTKPLDAICPISAHQCAYFYLVDYDHSENKIDSLEQYIKQGFPSISNSVFKNQVIDVLLKRQFNRVEQQYILKMLERVSASGYYSRYAQKLHENRVVHSDKWLNLLCSAASLELLEIDKILIDVIVKSKPTEESLTSLLETTKNSQAQTYFEGIVSQVIEILKPNGFFSKIKNLFRRNKK